MNITLATTHDIPLHRCELSQVAKVSSHFNWDVDTITTMKLHQHINQNQKNGKILHIEIIDFDDGRNVAANSYYLTDFGLSILKELEANK